MLHLLPGILPYMFVFLNLPFCFIRLRSPPILFQQQQQSDIRLHSLPILCQQQQWFLHETWTWISPTYDLGGWLGFRCRESVVSHSGRIMLRVHYSIHDYRRRGSFSNDGKNRDGGKYDCAVRILILALQSVRVLYGHEFCRNRREASHLYTQDEPPICCQKQLVLTSIVSLDMACRFHLPAVHEEWMCIYT